jgi:hypothetical protein
VTAQVFVLGHAYLAIAASLSLAVIVGTWLYARNERKSRQ